MSATTAANPAKSPTPPPSHPFFLDVEDTIVLFVDIQEAFAPTISNMDEVLDSAALMARATRVLEVPRIVTEQYPVGLGVTIHALSEALGPYTPIEKTVFSCARVPGFLDILDRHGRNSVVLCGIETHICVLQTALDLIAHGFGVWVVADGVGSRSESNRAIALAQMDRAGAVITSVEAVLFQLLGDARAPGFRDIQRLIL